MRLVALFRHGRLGPVLERNGRARGRKVERAKALSRILEETLLLLLTLLDEIVWTVVGSSWWG